MSVAATGATRRPLGPPLALSIVILVAGVVVAITGGIGAAVSVARSLATVGELPAVVQRHLEPGAYDIYQVMPTTIGAANVSVTGPDGASIPVLPPEPSTLDFAGDNYVAVAGFIVNSTGDYTVVIRYPGAGGGKVLIARAGGDLLHVPGAWLALLGSGAFVAVVGLVMLIVGVVRRDRTRARTVATTGAEGPFFVPAGWYPDPGGTARYRWWDGARWTDHTA